MCPADWIHQIHYIKSSNLSYKMTCFTKWLLFRKFKPECYANLLDTSSPHVSNSSVNSKAKTKYEVICELSGNDTE